MKIYRNASHFPVATLRSIPEYDTFLFGQQPDKTFEKLKAIAVLKKALEAKLLKTKS